MFFLSFSLSRTSITTALRQWGFYAHTVYTHHFPCSCCAFIRANAMLCTFNFGPLSWQSETHLPSAALWARETQQCKWQERVICTSQPPQALCTQTTGNETLLCTICYKRCNKNTAKSVILQAVLAQWWSVSWCALSFYWKTKAGHQYTSILVKCPGARNWILLSSLAWPLVTLPRKLVNRLPFQGSLKY